MDILVRHGSDWCKEADKLEEGAVVITEDPQKRMGPETWGIFEIRHEEHEDIHHIGLTPEINLALVFAKSFRVVRVQGFMLSPSMQLGVIYIAPPGPYPESLASVVGSGIVGTAWSLYTQGSPRSRNTARTASRP